MPPTMEEAAVRVVALFNRCIERIHVQHEEQRDDSPHKIGRYCVTVMVIFFEITGGL